MRLKNQVNAIILIIFSVASAVNAHVPSQRHVRHGKGKWNRLGLLLLSLGSIFGGVEADTGIQHPMSDRLQNLRQETETRNTETTWETPDSVASPPNVHEERIHYVGPHVPSIQFRIRQLGHNLGNAIDMSLSYLTSPYPMSYFRRILDAADRLEKELDQTGANADTFDESAYLELNNLRQRVKAEALASLDRRYSDLTSDIFECSKLVKGSPEWQSISRSIRDSMDDALGAFTINVFALMDDDDYANAVQQWERLASQYEVTCLL